MERLVTQEKQRKVKEAKFRLMAKSEGICLRKDKGCSLHSRAEVGIGDVAKEWEI